MAKTGTTKWVRLGDYIEQCDERNIADKYVLEDVIGISNQKTLIPTKADMKDVALTPYKLLRPSEFCYVTVTSRNGEKISLTINPTSKTYIVSSSYSVFRCKDPNILLPEYLFMLLNRSEFDRYARFNSWGSARETFDWSELCRVEIPLPSIEVQRELVEVYNGLKQLAEQNEALLPKLAAACHAYIVDCRAKYPSVTLGDFIEEQRNFNFDNQLGVEQLQGVTSDSRFDTSKANTNGLDFSKYKIVEKFDFAYNPSRINLGSIALQDKERCIISPMYVVFRLNEKGLSNFLPEFIKLWFSRKEFQRSTYFYAMGSVRDTFDINLMNEVQIPLPPIDVQQAIVDVYQCAERAKRIASDARERLKNLCPALVQRAAHS